MISGLICSVSDSLVCVFLDANILAKPVTRTLLMAGGPLSGFRTVWSKTAEQEALRHMSSRAVSPADIRRRFGGVLTPTGEVAGRFVQTSKQDRQILADAEAAGARYLVTEDVDDFAESDLTAIGISAVNPDLFLATRLTRTAYAMVINLFVTRQVAPPTTAEEFHRAIARQHPLLFTAHADLYDIKPDSSKQALPKILFRGPRPLDED